MVIICFKTMNSTEKINIPKYCASNSNIREIGSGEIGFPEISSGEIGSSEVGSR